MLLSFADFLFTKSFRSTYTPDIHAPFILEGFQKTQADILYHYPQLTEAQILPKIVHNSAYLSVFLYRAGNALFKENAKDPLLNEIHGLMREMCGCEIYYSINIGTGLEIRHGLGTVIGSRCEIGEGFIIHQNCTIGHKHTFGNGPVIGKNVEMGAGSKILGAFSIGDNVVIGANSLVLQDIPANTIAVGSPAKIIYP